MRAWRLINRNSLIVQFQVELRDCWIGLFWRKTEIAFHLYICLVPLIPLHITIRRLRVDTGKAERAQCRRCSECDGDHHWLDTVAQECKHCLKIRSYPNDGGMGAPELPGAAKHARTAPGLLCGMAGTGDDDDIGEAVMREGLRAHKRLGAAIAKAESEGS